MPDKDELAPHRVTVADIRRDFDLGAEAVLAEMRRRFGTRVTAATRRADPGTYNFSINVIGSLHRGDGDTRLSRLVENLKAVTGTIAVLQRPCWRVANPARPELRGTQVPNKAYREQVEISVIFDGVRWDYDRASFLLYAHEAECALESM